MLFRSCSSWVEAYPLPDKSNHSVWWAFAQQFLPRHGVPETVITDNGLEFCARSFGDYLNGIGVKHQRTTPVHPQSNGKVERVNRTIKEMLAKLVNNCPSTWERQLGPCLMAYNNAVNTTTGHTPFFLLYGRRARLPLSKLLPSDALPDNAMHKVTQLNDLANALQFVRTATEESRKYNRERLEKKANADDLEVGDSVVLKAPERMTFTSRWDPHWEITQVRGRTVWLRQQQTGKTKVVHREKVKLVDPTIAWDEVHPRPVRKQRPPVTRTMPPTNTESTLTRSEERRVGKECRSRWSPYH